MVLTTTDAGITWTHRSMPANLIGLNSVSCPTLDQCVAIGISSSENPSGIEPVVAATSDGGASWATFKP
jgi:hypothetical protein